MNAKSNYQFDRKEIIFILLIFFLALFLRVLYFCDYKNTHIYPFFEKSDGYSYFAWARDIASGDLWGSKVFMKWPLYAYFLASIFRVFGADITLVYILQFVLGAINCVLIYFIARILFNQTVALISGLLCAYYGLFIFYEGLLVYTSLSLFLNSLLFLFILSIKDKPKRTSIFFLGVFLGICTITQANIVIFGILSILWVIKRNRFTLGKALNRFLIFLLGLSIVMGAVGLRNYIVGGDPVCLSAGLGINFYAGNNPQATGVFFAPAEISLNQEDMFRDSKIIAENQLGRRLKSSEVSAFWLRKAKDFILRDPAAYLKLFLKKIIYTFSPMEFVHDLEYYLVLGKINIFKIIFMNLSFIMPLAILGIFLGFRRHQETTLLYLILFSQSLSISLFFVSARYRLTMVPFLVIFAGYGVFNLWERLKSKSYLAFGLSGITVITLFFLLNSSSLSKRIFTVETKINSSAFEYHMRRAVAYENNFNWQGALQEFYLARKIEPQNRRALFGLGLNYYRLMDFKAAEESFNEILKINPLSVDAYYNLGYIYNQQSKCALAKARLKKAVSLDPDDTGAHYELARAYKECGEYKEAKQEFEIALGGLGRWRKIDREIIIKELESLEK